MKFNFAIVLLITLTSCADLKKSDQLKSMGSLSTDVELVKETIAGLDDTLNVYVQKINQCDEGLKLVYQNDTLNYTLASSIDLLVQLKEVLPELSNEWILLDSMLNSKTTTIEQLIHDIELGAGDRSKYDEYLAVEQLDLDLLDEHVEVFKNNVDLVLIDFHSMYPQVNDYIKSFQEKE